MGDSALSVNLLGQLVQVDVAKIGRVLVSAVLVGSLGLLSPIFPVTLALATASLSLLVLGLVPFAIGWRNNRKNVWLSRLLVNLSKMTLHSVFFVSNDGEINSINQAARTKCVTSAGTTFAAVLHGV